MNVMFSPFFFNCTDLGTAMHELCNVGNCELVHSLIQKGLPVNEVNEVIRHFT